MPKNIIGRYSRGSVPPYRVVAYYKTGSLVEYKGQRRHNVVALVSTFADKGVTRAIVYKRPSVIPVGYWNRQRGLVFHF